MIEIYLLICEFLSGKICESTATCLAVDCFQGYIEGGYAAFFHISLLYLYAWIRAKMSPGMRPSVQSLDMERGGTHNCIKETASRNSSCACNIIVPFDSIIIINLAMKKKIRRNTNRPQDNAAARTIDVYTLCLAPPTFTN